MSTNTAMNIHSIAFFILLSFLYKNMICMFHNQKLGGIEPLSFLWQDCAMPLNKTGRVVNQPGFLFEGHSAFPVHWFSVLPSQAA
jgi:hypothetical protein